jgi:hypothetical protein
MLTYATLDGDILDLESLSPREREHFDRALLAYRSGMNWSAFMNEMVDGKANPLIDPGRRVTRRTLESPLYRALLDLGNRLGIQQGKFKPAEGDDLGTEPTEDREVPVAEAATRAGVSLKAVYLAIERGDLIATKDRPARVSRRSLDRWTPNVVRQRAGQAAGARLGRAG